MRRRAAASLPIVVERCRATETSAVGRLRIGPRAADVRFDGVAPDPASAPEAFAVIARVMGMEIDRGVLSVPRLGQTFRTGSDRFHDAHLALFPHHHRSPLRAPGRRDAPPDPNAAASRRVAAFFSGGVDSLDVVLEHGEEIDDLIFVRGFDIVVHDVERNEEVLRTVEAAAVAVGKPLMVIDTDLRDFSDPRADWTWFVYGGLIATAILLGRTHRKVICAASVADRHLPAEAVRLRAGEFGSELVHLVIEGRGATRVEKLERVAASGLAEGTLRVCWQNEPGTVNCGSCDKCIRTLVGLAAVGRIGAFATLPDTLDLGLVAAHPATTRSDRAYLVEARDAAASRGIADVVAALDAALAAGEPTSSPTGLDDRVT